jgi:hypothetical protein
VAAQRGQWRGRDHSADLARGVLHLVERIARLENGVHLHFPRRGDRWRTATSRASTASSAMSA